MIRGIAYNRIYPEVIYTLPSGLQVLKSRFFLAKMGDVCCFGGPIGAASSMINHIGTQSTVEYMSNLINDFNLESNINYFPGLGAETPIKKEHRKGGKAYEDPSSQINKVLSHKLSKHKEMQRSKRSLSNS